MHVTQLAQEGVTYIGISKKTYGTILFKIFNEGLRKLMGIYWRYDLDLSTDSLQAILEELVTRNQVRSCFYLVRAHVLSLKGPKFFSFKSRTYVTFALKVKHKGKNDECNHLFPAVEVTKSGIPVK